MLGGDRLRWEHELFAGAYDGALAAERRLGTTLDAAVIGRAAAVDGYTDELKDLWVMTVALGRRRGEV